MSKAMARKPARARCGITASYMRPLAGSQGSSTMSGPAPQARKCSWPDKRVREAEAHRHDRAVVCNS
jgi:hypothetical protein